MDTVQNLNAALGERYRIEREIGSGGMATVYLARDVKHDRWVALKVLKQELAAVLGTERFLSEIRVTANLQHPHLLPLFDSGEAEGRLFYVMPYVEGETLRDRIERERQLPVDEALRIATAVASALSYAHRHRVIHRDLKPENILLQDGQPVVSDFGIALAVTNAGGARITQTGLSLGTPHYMSPEQATGDRQLDARTDIYSLGAVIYEMLTGEPPHTGSTVQAVIARVLTDRPRSVRATRESVPEHVELAIDKALAKLPADRWGSASEFADALNGKVSSMSGLMPRPSRGLSSRRKIALMGVAILAAIAAGLTAAAIMRPEPRPVRVARFSLEFPDGQRHQPTAPGSTLALSPDGDQLAYIGEDNQLYVRRIDELQPRVIPGTSGARSPFFSPNGQWLAYVTNGIVRKVAVAGGQPIALATLVITSADIGGGGSWGDDGNIIVPGPGPTLLRISQEGGRVDTLPMPDTIPGEEDRRWPHVLPGARYAVYTTSRPNLLVGAQLAVVSLRDGATRLLGIQGTMGRYADGHLIVPQFNGTVMAVPFDVRRARITGPAFPVLENIFAKAGGAVALDVSASGALVYSAGSPVTRIAVVDQGGRVRTLLESPNSQMTYRAPRYSPDGKRIAIQRRGGISPLPLESDILVYDTVTRALSRVTFEGINMYPEWTPDGRRIVYFSRKDSANAAANGAYWRPADGSGPAELLLGQLGSAAEAVITTDGRHLVYREMLVDGDRNIGIMPVDRGEPARPLLKTAFSEHAMRVSPDSRWMAYVSNETGELEVFVRRFPDMQGRWQISSGGGSEPVWSRDGRTLYYWAANDLIAVRIRSGAAFEVIGQRTVMTVSRISNIGHAEYDVHPSGESFIMALPLGQNAPTVFVLDWTEEVRRRGRSAQPTR